MHGLPDDGYPALLQPGFAPFVLMLQRHVPWADERLRWGAGGAACAHASPFAGMLQGACVWSGSSGQLHC